MRIVCATRGVGARVYIAYTQAVESAARPTISKTGAKKRAAKRR